MATVHFRVEDECPLEEFDLVYKSAEQSFGPEPFPGGGEASLLLNDLNLELNGVGRVLYAWGYCPLAAAAVTSENPEHRRLGVLVADLEAAIVPGSSVRLNPEGRWPVYVNGDSGWVCIGEPSAPAGAIWIEFAPESLAVLVNSEIRAVWLRPASLTARGDAAQKVVDEGR